MCTDGADLTAAMPDDLEMDDEMLAAIAAAEAAVEAMADDYPELLLQDVGALGAAIDRLDASVAGTDEHASACMEIFGILHDIKGQAASFGYEAATMLADPLCELTRGVREVSPGLAATLREAARLLGLMAENGVTPDTQSAASDIVSALSAVN